MEQQAKSLAVLPFAIQEFKGMVGSEFFLQVIGHRWKKRAEEQKRRIGTPIDMDDGNISQVIESRPGLCEYYKLVN